MIATPLTIDAFTLLRLDAIELLSSTHSSCCLDAIELMTLNAINTHSPRHE